MTEASCDTCFYARPDPNGVVAGMLRCHKNAPSMNWTGMGDSPQFPPCPAHPNDWCGWWSDVDPNIYGTPVAVAKAEPKAKTKTKQKARRK